MNHHGRTRTLGGTEEKDDKDEDTPDTLHNHWVGESGTLELDLISRREDVQVCIEQKLFSHEIMMFALCTARNQGGAPRLGGAMG